MPIYEPLHDNVGLQSLLHNYVIALGEVAADQHARLERHEERIIDVMRNLHYFDNIRDSFNNMIAVWVTHDFDPANISHRLLLRYIHNGFGVESDIRTILEAPTQGIEFVNFPIYAFREHDLNIVSRTYASALRSSSANEQELQQHAYSPNYDFIVNGQKLRLSFRTFVHRNARPRYLSMINIVVTTERQTSAKCIVKLKSYDRGLSFKRVTHSRSGHGFKFVRVQGGLLVKEIK